MNTPTTRRDVLRSAAGLPLAAVALARARLRVPDRAPAPLPKAPAQPVDLTQLVNLVIDAVARRPLRLYEVLGLRATTFHAHMDRDHRAWLAALAWSKAALSHEGFVAAVPGHPLWMALARGELRGTEDHPGPVEMAVTDLACHGRAYWRQVTNRFRKPGAFHGLPCHRVVEALDRNGRVTEYQFHGRRPATLPARDVIRFHAPSALDPSGPVLRPLLSLGLTATEADRIAVAEAHVICAVIGRTLTEWTNRHPLAVELGWDRLVWAFDDAPAPQTRPRT